MLKVEREGDKIMCRLSEAHFGHARNPFTKIIKQKVRKILIMERQSWQSFDSS